MCLPTRILLRLLLCSLLFFLVSAIPLQKQPLFLRPPDVFTLSAPVTSLYSHNSTNLRLSPCRGCRDIYPHELRGRRLLFEKCREVSRLYGFEEYQPPSLEHKFIYSDAQLTRQSDGSSKVYQLTDEAGRDLVLRPELTPSLTRMVARHPQALPLKWFSIGSCWRYERPELGRKREHRQWNVDIWGVEGVEAEAELLALAVDLLSQVGLGPADVVIRVNHREITAALLEGFKIDSRRTNILFLLDKMDRTCLCRQANHTL
eukprot:GHVS01074421.1.p1 GENE.GHVS01074421.1~~GHVS01074421.1.p1  ORF type:complete len:276 (-),score=27.52 GHVS01074421.1:143-922(-)